MAPAVRMVASTSSPYHIHAQPSSHSAGGAEKSDMLKGLQDVYWSDEEEEDPECPLCMEEMDLSDINFKPCPCGYQICRFCHHHILANLNKRCPACRRQYTEEGIEFIPVGAEEIKLLTALKRNKAKTNKELEALGRRHLKDVRVVVKNMVYVVGMGVGQEGRSDEQLATLRSNDYFGQYGKISKLLLHKRPPSSAPPSSSGPPPPNVGIYISYLRREDAARAISALDGFPSPSAPGQVLRASFGTAKYCESWLRGVKCDNLNCLGLHDWGDERDCFTKEDLSTLKHTLKGTEHLQKPVIVARPVAKKVEEVPDASALPRTASWASRPGTGLASLPPNPTLPAPPGLKAQTPIPTPAQPQPVPSRLQPKPKPVTSSPAPSSSTPQQVTILAKPTPFKSTSKTTPATASSSTSGPSVGSSSRPGTPASGTTTAKASIGIVSSTTNRPTPSSTPTSSVAPIISTTLPTPSPTVSSPAPPPPPPGLGLPSFNQQPPPPSSLEPIPAHLQSPYQPSTQTQALVDEITARREAPGPPAFTSSPFPDFEAMLSTIGDGQFAFNLNLEQPKGSSSSRSKNAEPSMLSPSAFSPFGYSGGASSLFGLLSSESLVATPYAGSFDPWGDSPRPAAPADPDMVDEQSGGKKSRFDFARRKASAHHFGGSPSPGGRSLGLPPVEGDSRRGSIDSEGLMMKDGGNGGRYGREPSGRITPTPSATTSTDQSSYLWAGSNNHHDPPPHQHPQQLQQQQQSRSSNNSSPAPFGRHPPPGLPSSAGGPGHLARQGSSSSSNFPTSSAPPPPGLGLKSPLQGQQHQQLHHQQPGGAGNWIHQIPQQQQQQQQQGSIGGDASRMAFARQQQGYANGGGDRGNQAQALKDMLGVGGGMGSMGGMGMGMGMGAGGGADHNHMPFQDPAIMSFRSSQQQQQQQHQYSNNGQQQHGPSNNQFSPELGMHGVGGTTDPSSLGAFAAFASQSLNAGNARLLHQIQHQQQQQVYYGVQQGQGGGRGPSPSPPLGSTPVLEETNVFDFPPLPPGLARLATTPTPTASTHATRFVSNQAATPASKTSSPSSSSTHPFTPSDSESSSNSTPLRPTDVQIAVQSATPNFPTAGSPGPEWSSVWGESPSRSSRASLLGAQGWTPGLERRMSLEAIEGRMSKEEEERVEELVGEHDEEEEEREEGLRAEEEEVEREVELAGVEEPVVEKVVVVVKKKVGKPKQQQQQQPELVREEIASSSTTNLVSISPTDFPELPVSVAPTPHPDEVRAAVRAASADKPAPVTISLRSKPLAVPTPPPVEKPVVVEKTATSALKSASVKSTPTSTRPGTPTKAGKGTPKQQSKVGTLVIAEPSPSKTPKLVAKSSSSVVSAAKLQQVNTPPPPPPAAPVFVEQAPLLSKMAKKAKVPKVKKNIEVEKENSASPDGGDEATKDDASTKINADQLPPPLGPSSCGANEILVPTSSLLDVLPPIKPIASLPELLHQISYLIDCNSLAFFSPSLPSISLPSTSTGESTSQPNPEDDPDDESSTPLSSQTLALALSALSSSNPTVSMEEAVSSFHVLLSLLTGRIAGVLGALPNGCRGAVSGKFEGMFGEGGEGIQTDGFDELDDEDEEEEEHGVEGEIMGGGGGLKRAGDEVERLRSALGRRASYLAKQLGRLEELHREINVIALDSLVPRFAAIAPSTSDLATASSAELEAELEKARRAVEETTRELENVMEENAKVFGEVGGR